VGKKGPKSPFEEPPGRGPKKKKRKSEFLLGEKGKLLAVPLVVKRGRRCQGNLFGPRPAITFKRGSFFLKKKSKPPGQIPPRLIGWV